MPKGRGGAVDISVSFDLEGPRVLHPTVGVGASRSRAAGPAQWSAFGIAVRARPGTLAGAAVTLYFNVSVPDPVTKTRHVVVYGTHADAGQSKIRKQNSAPSGFEMCLAPSTFSQHVWCRGSQPKHVSNPDSVMKKFKPHLIIMHDSFVSGATCQGAAG